ncbi:MAG: three-Cys-motif partner protein TcmP [Rickettsiales bacterium]|nr:three-Cys-motif partner protein TcmP [Rickettsiales bacterium]
MDTKNLITEHSKVKLEIYKEYLKAYLAIMTLPNVYYRNIYVIDPFAGMGKSDNGESGSAVIANNVFTEMLPTFTTNQKSPHLALNEIDAARLAKLKENVPAQSYIDFSGDSADKFISDISNTLNNLSHALYFIDPFGYTQISKNTYDSYLFGKTNSDILIFIPVYHIYRFLKKEETSEQLKPIAEFLKDIDISENNAKNVKNYQEFIKVIVDALKERANTQFVYYKILDNEKSNSHYALFYISKNILGAEKFLEIMDKMKQPNLFYNIISEPEQVRFVNGLEKNKVLNNRQVYQGGIVCGLLSKGIRKILKSLEDEGKISVKSLIGYERKRKAFPVDYDDYINQQPKIEITWIGK